VPAVSSRRIPYYKSVLASVETESDRLPFCSSFDLQKIISRFSAVIIIVIIPVTKTIPLNSSCRSPRARYTVKPREWNLDQSTVVHANGGGCVKGIKYMYSVSRNSLRDRFPPPSRVRNSIKSTTAKAIENRLKVIFLPRSWLCIKSK